MNKRLFCMSLLITCGIFLITGCGQKKEGKSSGTDSVSSTNFVKKDSVTGKEKYHLSYVVKKGDKFA